MQVKRGGRAKRPKKGSISEDDASILLERYNPITVLKLLQEVAQFADAKIDWNALVKKTTTGISCAREYQLLWRHLAYRHSLAQKSEDVAEPQDDDSDLEYELEASPGVSYEAVVEAAACVKVLITSGFPSDSIHPNGSTMEAPLTINVPSAQSSRAHLGNPQTASSMQGRNIIVPVSFQIPVLPTGTVAEDYDANGAAPQRRRRRWTAAEDRKLIAAVQKWGEGDWVTIVKGNFSGDRTPAQLSQRWAIIRKRHGNFKLAAANSNGPQLSAALLATRHAMSMALNIPVGNLAKTGGTVASSGSKLPSATKETSLAGNEPISPLSSQVMVKKRPVKPIMSSNSMLQAAAVAAPEDATSLLKAAQSKNAVRIIPGGGSLIKSSSSSLPNVHYVRTGSSASSYSTGLPSATKPGLAKPSTQASQTTNATTSSMVSEKTNATTTVLSTQEAVPKSTIDPKEHVLQVDTSAIHTERARQITGDDKTVLVSGAMVED